jgi:phosphopantothenoylcysteine decarboxylase / phosphopantothenate---cysteine ligase
MGPPFWSTRWGAVSASNLIFGILFQPVTSHSSLHEKTILLGVTGSIAAYKAVLITRLLRKAGAVVHVILTEAAERFVGAETFRGLGAHVHQSMWGTEGEPHILLAQKADAIVIAPMTADTLARLAQGRSDDLLTATVLASKKPLFVAPAMHPSMFDAAATRENVSRLKARGVHFLGPVEGEVASGDVGLGRMEEPESIVSALALSLFGPRYLTGKHIVITAGPTREPLDPVRSLTNVSSGKMGFALAREATAMGAEVTLVVGAVDLPTPPLVARIDAETALGMREVLWDVLKPDLSGADALIMAAAVADYRPERASTEKLKRADGGMTLKLAPNPDLLKEIGTHRKSARPVLVGFALETVSGDALIQHARRKLVEKRVDLIVANSAKDSLGLDTNQVLMVTPQDCRPLSVRSKTAVSAEILEWVARRLAAEPGEWTA